MSAVVCHGPKDYRLEEVPIPQRSPGEALIEVEAVGICASDLKCFNGAVKFWGDGERPAYAETNVIPGHEFVGVVSEIDDAASRRWGVEVGDRVVSEQIVPCWKCRYCHRGQYWMCAVNNVYGFKRVTQGGMASHMVFPVEALVHTVSKDLPAAHAAFTEPLACSLHAVERAGISFNDVVVVAGCGPIGLGMIAGAAAKSPANVVALDVSPDRLALARRCGATETVNVAAVDPTELVMDLTEGYGADVYLEGSGHPSAVPQGLGPAAQARHVPRVQRVRLGGDGRLDHHQRRQGARRSRGAPRPTLLAGGDPDDRERRPPPRRDLLPPTAARRLRRRARPRRRRQPVRQGHAAAVAADSVTGGQVGEQRLGTLGVQRCRAR